MHRISSYERVAVDSRIARVENQLRSLHNDPAPARVKLAKWRRFYNELLSLYATKSGRTVG
jgi:hypothetical protein